ncbi:MAG: MerR family transcriptional regulator [Thermotogota bacterium]
MDKWVNKSKISDITGIPYSTLSRILSRLNHFFDAKRDGKKRLYRESQINLIEKIRDFLNEGKTYDEIYDLLSENHAQYLEHVNEEGTVTIHSGEPPRMYKAIEIIANQEKDIKELKEKVSLLESKMERERTELLHEINEMLLEFMKNNR